MRWSPARRDMPLEDSHAAHAKLIVHGDDAADEVCKTYFPELDAQLAKDQMLAAKLFVRSNKQQFMFPVDEQDPTKGSERADSHINAVKTKGRTLLGDDTFNDAIWLTYNLPPLHLVDYDRFVTGWKEEGTQRMGIFKGAEAADADDPNSSSQVVRRHLSAGSS